MEVGDADRDIDVRPGELCDMQQFFGDLVARRRQWRRVRDVFHVDLPLADYRLARDLSSEKVAHWIRVGRHLFRRFLARILGAITHAIGAAAIKLITTTAGMRYGHASEIPGKLRTKIAPVPKMTAFTMP